MGKERHERGPPQDRSVVYCLIPADLAPKLHEPLRKHFRKLAGVEVVVEARIADRREGAERRRSGGEPPGALSVA